MLLLLVFRQAYDELPSRALATKVWLSETDLEQVGKMLHAIFRAVAEHRIMAVLHTTRGDEVKRRGDMTKVRAWIGKIKLPPAELDGRVRKAYAEAFVV